MRLDQYLVVAGLVATRSIAQRLIDAGEVEIDGKKILKASFEVGEGNQHSIIVQTLPRYVSRGGEKLAAALTRFESVNVHEVLDIGASTGGFTDCALQYGAVHVTALDVGHDQLHPKLRNDPAVTVLEGVNIREFKWNTLIALPTLVTVDVSFISLGHVFTYLAAQDYEGDVIALIKPQFELTPSDLDKHGVVKLPTQHVQALLNVMGKAAQAGYSLIDLIYSPIRGEKSGNIEFLGHFKALSSPVSFPINKLQECVTMAHKEL